jgi:hypothetical protein
MLCHARKTPIPRAGGGGLWTGMSKYRPPKRRCLQFFLW